jgi:nucleotide-binding universal stress UspA family protein
MRELGVPVLVVRPGSDGKAPTPRVRRILVALDGTPFAETILDDALGFGRAFGAEYALVSAVEPPLHLMDMVSLAGGPDQLDLECQMVKSAQRYLTRIAERLRGEGHVVSAHAVSGLRVHETLLDQADRLGADLIAISTHGRAGFKRLTLGSVTDKVVRGSSHPVLVVRPQPVAVSLFGSATAA